MLKHYLEEYKEFVNNMYPNSTLDFSNALVSNSINSTFKTIELIDIYRTSTPNLKDWICLKLREINNQLLLFLYYLPHMTNYILNVFQRSISELILKITLYSFSSEISSETYINTMQFRELKSSIKQSSKYNSFKNKIDNFFSFYGSSSNDIHFKNSTNLISNIESYNSSTELQIKQIQSFMSKVELFFLEIFPKIQQLNDLEFTMVAKKNLKNLMTTKKYAQYFCY